jgi:hypothetical protein
MNVTIIYELSKNGIPFYIGKSKNPKTRISSHKKKFGDFNITYIDEVPNDEWEFWEKYWIMQYKAWGFILENITHGGNGISFHTDESKQKIGKKLKNRISPSKGKKMSEEEKQLRSQKAKERFLKNPHPSKGKKYEDWPSGESHKQFGTFRTDKTKQQMSKAAKQRWKNK